MGLDRFANFISKSINNDGVEEINIESNLRKIISNHIIFDLNFLIYQEIVEIENEINDIIKVILCLPFSNDKHDELENILKSIFMQPHWRLYYLGSDLEKIFDGYNEDEIINKFINYISSKITSNINNPMDIISNLNGFYYIPNDIAISNCSAKNKEDIGLSAQDVNKILPHIVNLAPFDSFVDNSNNLISKSGCNYLTVNYEKLAPVFIEAIKTLNEKIIYLTNEIEKLKAKD